MWRVPRFEPCDASSRSKRAIGKTPNQDQMAGASAVPASTAPGTVAGLDGRSGACLTCGTALDVGQSPWRATRYGFVGPAPSPAIAEGHTMTATTSPIPSPRPLGVIRCAASAALSLMVLFALCWAGAVVVESQSHMFIALFTTQPVSSTTALVEGLCWSLVFGAVAGALIAAFYNLLSRFDRR